MKGTVHYSEEAMYKNDYVQFSLELVGERYFLHIDILKKDENTRDQVMKTWIGLQEYLLANGITEVSGLVEEDNETLKEFIKCYSGKKELDCTDGYEIWTAEIR